MSEQDYKTQLQQLLPPGPLWDSLRDPDSIADPLFEALAVELARIDTRAAKLLDETDPRTVDELLPEWEEFAGLPDPCAGQAETLQGRRQALHARLIATGGQSRQYFIDIAAALGFIVDISEPQPYVWVMRVYGSSTSAQVDEAVIDDPLDVVDEPIYESTIARAGAAVAGDPLRSWFNHTLECPIRRLKPAHSRLLFAYGVEPEPDPEPDPPLVLWEQLASGAPRDGHASVVINGLMYVFGGDDGFSIVDDLWVYDPAMDSWAQLTGGPAGRSGHSAVAINGLMYVFGGQSGNGVWFSDLWAYDPAADSWAQLANAPADRLFHCAVAMGGKKYVFGGQDGLGTRHSDLWVYDPATDSWTQLASGATAPVSPSVVAMSGKMYVFGGFDGTDDINDLWVYDPATDSWAQLTSGPIARSGHSAVAMSGKMYVFGGFDGTDDSNDLWVYDPATNSWAQLTSGPAGRSGHSATAIDDLMYVFGGYNITNYFNDLWAYNPAAE